MSDLTTSRASATVVSIIRTWVPTGIGAVLAWLLTLGIELDPDAQAGLITGLTAVMVAAYYALARLLESRWPWLGVLLGSTRQPTYAPMREADGSTRQGFDAPTPN